MSAADWSVLFCALHQSSSSSASIIDKAVHLMVKQKCGDYNKELRAKVARRTRQALSFKNNVGLRNTEDEAVMDPQDLELLLGPQQPGFAIIIFECVGNALFTLRPVLIYFVLCKYHNFKAAALLINLLIILSIFCPPNN